MAVMDEFKEEREAIKEASFKKRAEYFWDYYKIHTLVTIVVIVGIIIFVQSYLTAKDSVLFAAMVNSYAEVDDIEEIQTEYLELIEANSLLYSATISSSIYLDFETEDTNHQYSMQMLVTYLAAGEMDILAGDEEAVGTLAYQNAFMDLEEVLTEEEIAMYEDQFFYVDQAVVDEVELLNDEYADTTEYPDYVYGDNPDEMEDPVAIGIYADLDSTMMETFYYYEEEEGYIIGIISNSARLDNAREFMMMMLD